MERYQGLARVEAYFITHARVSYDSGQDPAACVRPLAGLTDRAVVVRPPPPALVVVAQIRSKDKQANRSGAPQWGGALVRVVETGVASSDTPARRLLARIRPSEFASLAALETHEFVGQLVSVAYDDAEECNVLHPIATAAKL